ncbi:DUF4037 domain-containing protein [Alkalispirochaeta americana]|nr:DUF4037 domain-containing protein [Alkalispirochaeta americana]
MDAILRTTNEQILGVLQGWDSLEALSVLRFGTDRYDPSFFISYDVYHRGPIPEPGEREQLFTFAVSFESTRDGEKDRIMVEDIPVRLEYKPVDQVDRLVLAASDGGAAEASVTSTYGFFRLLQATAILERGDWLRSTRKTLQYLPDAFWAARIAAYQARMDHVLADLTSAAYAGEALFYQLSLAAFLEALSSLLFAVNREFEPPGRTLQESLLALPVLPEEFETRLAYLLRSDVAISDTRRREIARLITLSALRLS